MTGDDSILMFHQLSGLKITKRTFYNLLQNKYEQNSEVKRKNFFITQETYDEILDVLCLESSVNSRSTKEFRSWVRKKLKLVVIGTKNLVYCMETNNPLATKEELFDILKQ